MNKIYKDDSADVSDNNQFYYNDVQTESRSFASPLLKLYNWIFRFDDGEKAGVQSEAAFQPTGTAQNLNDINSYTHRAEQVKRALQDWKTATAYFESVSDPALIDFASYEMEAARRKYIYLLNSAKEMSRQA